MHSWTSLLPLLSIFLVLIVPLWRRRRRATEATWRLESFLAGRDRRRFRKVAARRWQIGISTVAVVFVMVMLRHLPATWAAGTVTPGQVLVPAGFLAAVLFSVAVTQRQIQRDESLLQSGRLASATVEEIGTFTDRGGRGRVNLRITPEGETPRAVKIIVRDPHRFTKGETVAVFYDPQRPKLALLFDELESRDWRYGG